LRCLSSSRLRTTEIEHRQAEVEARSNAAGRDRGSVKGTVRDIAAFAK
jgi:hypothetical protein